VTIARCSSSWILSNRFGMIREANAIYNFPPGDSGLENLTPGLGAEQHPDTPTLGCNKTGHCRVELLRCQWWHSAVHFIKSFRSIVWHHKSYFLSACFTVMILSQWNGFEPRQVKDVMLLDAFNERPNAKSVSASGDFTFLTPSPGALPLDPAGGATLKPPLWARAPLANTFCDLGVLRLERPIIGSQRAS